jgi:hypothetical protein
METARVDIRKLQLLNDRINQCLDALNQVRLTVHGLSHSGAQMGNPAIGQGGALGIDPRLAAGNPFGGAGLSHTPYAQSPFAQNPIGQLPFAQAGFPQTGFAQTGFPQTFGATMQPFGAAGGAQQGFPQWGQQGGLAHSDLESLYGRPVWSDPVVASRVKETFPFIGYALPPVVSIY